MTILSGPQIRDEVGWGTIEIDPYDEKRVQPNSIDLTLGKIVRVYTFAAYMSADAYPDSPLPESGEASYYVSRRLHPREGVILDARKKNDAIELAMDESGWLVKPGILYLMHTAERIHTKKFVTQLNGKSSIARLGVIVHFTAAYGETGFNGQYTLEVSAVHPVRLYPGMAIAQAVFYNVYGQTEDYQAKGHYTGKAALGAEPSHSWEQFDERQRVVGLQGR
jgi:dCTP deaminase